MSHNHTHTREGEITKVTLWGSLVNAVLVVFKFAAGVLGHSGAMLADAIHSLSDFVTDIIVVVFVRISSKPRDEQHEYGHGKYETLAELILGVVLMVVAAEIIATSVESIHGVLVLGVIPSQPERIALYAAVVSIVLKELLYQYTVRVGRRENSPVVIANAWHHRSDALSSVAALIGIGLAYALGGKWVVADSVAALFVAVLIIKVGVDIISPALGVFLEKSLPKETESEIADIIVATPGVCNFHNLRTRRIGSVYAIEFHIRVDGSLSVNESHLITKQLEQSLRERYGSTTHIAIHVEPYKNKTLKN